MIKNKVNKNQLNKIINSHDFFNTLNRINELKLFIDSFNDIFGYINNNDLKGKIELFKSNFERFSNIERFAIPVIGKINSGKSTFLNYLLDLNDLLESSEKITTKFICLIRHNQNLKDSKPKFFKVKIEERMVKVEKEEKNKINENKKDEEIFYNFFKGEEIKDDVKKIIENINKFLSDKTKCKGYNDYFYILEAYIPFFPNFGLEEISKYFEFVDVPGLNEISDKEKDNIYIKFLNMFKNNICFPLFIFDSLFYRDEINSKEILLKFN